MAKLAIFYGKICQFLWQNLAKFRISNGNFLRCQLKVDSFCAILHQLANFPFHFVPCLLCAVFRNQSKLKLSPRFFTIKNLKFCMLKEANFANLCNILTQPNFLLYNANTAVAHPQSLILIYLNVDHLRNNYNKS